MASSNLPTFEFAEDDATTTSPMVNKALELDETTYSRDTLSPMSAHFPPFLPTKNANPGSPHHSSYLSPNNPSFGMRDNDQAASTNSEADRQPFNFTPQQYTVGRSPAASLAATKSAELGRRRGHKYARSSISHQIILSPTPRLPLQLPTNLPIPTFKEFRTSMTSQQRGRWVFCILQFLIAGYVQWKAHDSMSMTALSHLLFFDAFSAILCNAMDVGRNFEVWTRSSLRNPFGLERSELVAGLAMSIVLLFMGLDLVSHGLTHSLENTGGHVAHHAHIDTLIHPYNIDVAALSAILSTLISAATLGNHSRIGRFIRPSTQPSWLPYALQNPSHLLTLSCASLLLLLPMFTNKTSSLFDTILSLTIALSMILIGSRLAYNIGRVLLMSFPARDDNEIKDLVAELGEDSDIVAVDEARVWQVHYSLCMANFRVRVRGREQVRTVRDKIERLVKKRLAGESDKVRWEISSMVTVDRD
ncbi:uncharacterized protein PV09_01020 [Verruconis gallopava]|uniref:Zinc transporter n=1 Tax=Verruconis gallopava TaxID=253628 RepID=A0A0D2ANK1_9PEZI|nr:uncharacterized protein PV09_01020 [Verruconis gallopava]KIW08080.1 hypothetical protein PV09_01020 [Verruconis gallopava]